jgi:hypothetical protein
MKLPLVILATVALAACSRQAEQNVAEHFDATQNAIENAAAALEAETANATRAATGALENQAAEVENRAEAVEKAATTPSTGNSAK